MSKAPSMPVFTDALIGDTTDLSIEEFGAYTMLLFVTWRNNGAPLPDDPVRMARICRMSEKRWSEKIRPVLVRFFDLSEGTWRQARLEKEWNFVAKQRANQSDKGKKSAEAKSLKNNDTHSTAVDVRLQPEANPHTQPLIEEQESKKEKEREAISISGSVVLFPFQPAPPSAPPPAKTGTRLSDDWFLPKEWGEWALAEGLSVETIRQEADTFRDYWIAKPGKDGRKTDWQATWRNWVRRSQSHNKGNQNNGQRRTAERQERNGFAILNRELESRAGRQTGTDVGLW